MSCASELAGGNRVAFAFWISPPSTGELERVVELRGRMGKAEQGARRSTPERNEADWMKISGDD